MAAVLGIMEDAHLSIDDFGWLGSIFYLGYLVCQVIINQAMRVAQ